MSRKTLSSFPGLTPAIGFCFAGMEEVRSHLHETVAGLTKEQIGRPAFAGAHSIGALVLHIGEAEWYWMHMVVLGHELTDADRSAPCWDVLQYPDRFHEKGHSVEFCLNEIKAIRTQTGDTLASFNDADLERIFSIKRRGEVHERSLRWILHHLMDHEAQHKGQILMLKRLMGLTNDGAFD